jgi:hypothetical protein
MVSQLGSGLHGSGSGSTGYSLLLIISVILIKIGLA